jgi:hypothetical protein
LIGTGAWTHQSQDSRIPDFSKPGILLLTSRRCYATRRIRDIDALAAPCMSEDIDQVIGIEPRLHPRRRRRNAWMRVHPGQEAWQAPYRRFAPPRSPSAARTRSNSQDACGDQQRVDRGRVLATGGTAKAASTGPKGGRQVIGIAFLSNCF